MDFRRLLFLLGLGGVLQQMEPDARVVDLRIYPVKSCAGISLQTARTSKTGLAWDRLFAVVDRAGRIQTQRQRRRMATIRPALDVERGTLTLHADEMPSLELPLQGTAPEGCTQALVDKGGDSAVSNMPVWQYPEEATQWLTRVLATSPGVRLRDGADIPPAQEEVFRLVRFDTEAGYTRRIMDNFGGENALPEDQVAFPDLFPLLLTTNESLQEVNRQVGGLEVTMDRFRPNIVVSGAAKAFDEDSWAVVEVGDGGPRTLRLRCLEGDPRCQVPSIDQRTGQINGQFEPTRTLRKFRQNPDILGRDGTLARAGPMFGVYAAHGAQPGELRVGDTVKVVERSDAGSLHEYWTRKKATQGFLQSPLARLARF